MVTIGSKKNTFEFYLMLLCYADIETVLRNHDRAVAVGLAEDNVCVNSRVASNQW